jgi:hypothetical protein
MGVNPISSGDLAFKILVWLKITKGIKNKNKRRRFIILVC